MARPRGTPNQSCLDLVAIADKLKVHPFKILIQFAANDWESLGYSARTRKEFSKTGEVIEVEMIPPEERIKAARYACEYIYPKRKALEITGAQGQDLFQSVTDVFKQLSDKANEPKPIDVTKESKLVNP